MTRFDEYGFGEDPRLKMESTVAEINQIDKDIEQLKDEYRKLFPKREIFKQSTDL